METSLTILVNFVLIMLFIFPVWANNRIGHITVPMAPTNLTWTHTISRKKDPPQFPTMEMPTVGFYTVSSDRRNNDTIPITIECHLNTTEAKGTISISSKHIVLYL